MTTQIIFFISLAAFIVLLAKRYSPNLLSSHKITQSLTGGFGQLFGRINLKKISLPKVNLRLSKTIRKTVISEDSHEFWQEELHSAKGELSSHFEEGEELLAQGKAKEAEQYFLRAATSNPSDARVYAKLGLLYLNQKNYSDAIESLKMAVKFEKYNPSRHYNLALAYWGNKDVRRAIASVREAISLDPVTPKYRKLLEELLNG